MVRIILGVVGGVLIAFVTVAAIEFVGSLVFPQAAPLDWVEQVASIDGVAGMPSAAKLLVVVGWLVGALAGAFAAGRIARRPAMGWIAAVLVLIAGIATIAMIPHPLWMSAAAILAPIAGGWCGVWLARRSTVRAVA